MWYPHLSGNINIFHVVFNKALNCVRALSTVWLIIYLYGVVWIINRQYILNGCALYHKDIWKWKATRKVYSVLLLLQSSSEKFTFNKNSREKLNFKAAVLCLMFNLKCILTQSQNNFWAPYSCFFVLFCSFVAKAILHFKPPFPEPYGLGTTLEDYRHLTQWAQAVEQIVSGKEESVRYNSKKKKKQSAVSSEIDWSDENVFWSQINPPSATAEDAWHHTDRCS